METTTSFDLNRAMQQWRERLGESPVFRSENLDELESHLGDSITALRTRGLSAEEAFLVAVTRIGKGAALESEFGKVNRTAVWLERLFWMLIGCQAWAFISGVIGLIARNALSLGLDGAGYDFRSHGTIIPVALSTLVYLGGCAGSLALCWALLHRKGHRVGRWLGRLLDRRTTRALAFGAIYLLSLSVTLIGWVTQSLLARSLGRDGIAWVYFSQNVSSAVNLLITTAVFVGLTLFLARKRLRVIQA